MAKISKQPFTPRLEAKILDGFRAEARRILDTVESFDTCAFLVEEGEQFIGAIVVQPIWGALYIKYLFIDQAFRKQGYGKMLVEYAVAYAQQERCAFLFLETMSHLGAVDFYRKLGFVIEHSRSGYTNGLVYQYMRKNLE